jgi:hypothetical protein
LLGGLQQRGLRALRNGHGDGRPHAVRGVQSDNSLPVCDPDLSDASHAELPAHNRLLSADSLLSAHSLLPAHSTLSADSLLPADPDLHSPHYGGLPGRHGRLPGRHRELPVPVRGVRRGQPRRRLRRVSLRLDASAGFVAPGGCLMSLAWMGGQCNARAEIARGAGHHPPCRAGYRASLRLRPAA